MIKRYIFAALTAVLSFTTTLAHAVDPPPAIAATAIENNVTVSWTEVAGATGYNIYRDDVYLDTVRGVVTFTDIGLAELVEHSYSVATFVEDATGAATYSPLSQSVAVTTERQTSAEVCEVVQIFFPDQTIPQNVELLLDANGVSGEIDFDPVAGASDFLLHLNGVFYASFPVDFPDAIVVDYSAGDAWTVSSTDGSVFSPRSEIATVIDIDGNVLNPQDELIFALQPTPTPEPEPPVLTDADLIELGLGAFPVDPADDPTTTDTDMDLAVDALDIDPSNPCVPFIQAGSCVALVQ